MGRRLDVTDRIVAADLCTGCGHVRPLRRSMSPWGTVKTASCVPTQNGCPEKRRVRSWRCVGRRQTSRASYPFTHPLWGGYHKVLQGWSTDEDMRFAAASGGALSAVLVHLLDQRAGGRRGAGES